MPSTFSALSKEYVRVPIGATESGSPVDPTSDSVTMAFAAPGVTPTSFNTASWETDTTANPDKHYARSLIGPGTSNVLTAGRYSVYVKITDNPEIPVLPAGEIIIV